MDDLICIPNASSPLVVLFGPASSGKTMALIRLIRYLHMKGYSVNPERLFRPTYYNVYQDVCNTFSLMCYDIYAAKSTSSSEMLLVKVIDRQGRIVCQLLDAPGPYFFDPNVPLEPWCNCINYIRHLRNQRVWLYFVENNWRSLETRIQYAHRIKYHTYNSSRKDQSIFVFSKVDKSEFMKGSCRVDMSNLYRAIENQYPDLFAPFTNKPPLRWFKKYNCQFVPFSSGYFHRMKTGEQCYVPSEDVYPKMLWEAIHYSIK